MADARTSKDWVAEYGKSHQHPVNKLMHLFGIPMIAVSLPLMLASMFRSAIWPYAAGLFVVGWILQFVGHAFEGKPPEFLKDWRFLFVGLRWWAAKIANRWRHHRVT